MNQDGYLCSTFERSEKRWFINFDTENNAKRAMNRLKDSGIPAHDAVEETSLPDGIVELLKSGHEINIYNPNMPSKKEKEG